LFSAPNEVIYRPWNILTCCNLHPFDSGC